MYLPKATAPQKRPYNRNSLAVIAGLLAILFGIAMYFFTYLLTELNARIEFSEKELLGLEYIHPLFMLKREILDYRDAVIAQKDDPFQAQSSSLQRQVEKAIELVDRVDQSIGPALSTKTIWNEIKEDWQIIQTKPSNEWIHHSIDSPLELIADLNALIAQTGDRSNLILDSRLDGYYLSETLAKSLPRMVEQLDLARSMASSLAEPPKSLLRMQQPFSNHAKLIKLTRRAIARNLDIFFKYTPNTHLRSTIEAKMHDTDAALDRLQGILKSEAAGGIPTDRLHAIRQAATTAIGATVQLFDGVVAAQKETVQVRIAHTHRQKLSIEAISGLVTTSVVFLFLVFLRIDRQRRQAELDVAAQENRLQAVIDGALDAVVTMDHRSLIVEWNPQADAIFGFSKVEAIGKPLAELIIPERYREAHIKGLQRFLSTGQAKILRQRIEITAIRKTGEEFPVELTVVPIQHGSLTFFSSFIRDITEQKRANDSLQESTNFMESVLEHLPNMVFVKDEKDLRFVRVNKAGEELLGHSRSQLLGKNDFDFFPREEAEFFIAKDRETLSTRRLVDIPEEPVRTKSNGTRILHTKKIPICKSDGTPQYLLGISEDITERKQAIQGLRESEERFQLAVRGSSDGIWDWNMVTDEAYFSPRYKELLGYGEDEFPNVVSTFWVHLNPEDRPWVTTAIRAHLERKSPYDIEYRMRTKSGEYRWFRARGQAMWNDTGKPVRMAGSITDITKNKEAEAVLISSQHEIRKASKAKSDFLANMSHEMRTPLNAIVGITDFLKETALSTEQRSLIQRCAKAGDGLLRMIEELLLAAKAESGTLALNIEPFGLSEMVTECAGLLATDVQIKGLSLSLQLDPDIPVRLIGDGYRLKQVLLNLMRNAVKFTPTGSISVRVSLVSTQHGQAELLFRVVDTGVGIPAGQREVIFERFTQVDAQTAGAHGGVGLGLSICKELIALMGGRIWAENNQGSGSTFSFTIQLKIDESARPRTEGPRPTTEWKKNASDQSLAVPARALRILLAEDFIDFQDIMRLYLRGTPHQLDCASTGHDALALFKTKPYDIVFMDLQMPEMDGYHATCLIRAWEAEQGRPPTPIVALSANGLDAARQESLAAGCSEYLTKPIKRDAVLQAIQRYASCETEGAPRHPSTGFTHKEPAVADELQQLKSKFLRNRQRDVTALEIAIAEKQFDRIRTIGHRMKGLAGSYELHDIETIGGHIEQAALNHDLRQVTDEVSRLSQAVRTAIEASPDDTGYNNHAA